jgi:DNA-binding MarR family transcriptional regulator
VNPAFFPHACRPAPHGYGLLSMLRAHIDVAMDGPRDRNIFGAFALMISDDIVRASSSRAPEAGPAASALALIAHMPGLSIRMLSIGVGLSHAATVRLVDRLAAEGLVERREHFTDGRTRSLYLTAAGKIASDEVLSSRDEVIAEGLSILSPDELKVLGAIAERVLRNRLENLEHSYRICRLCCYEGCTNCPIDAELHERGVDRENSGEA